MIAESLDHAFEDMAERSGPEAALKSNELLPAVGSALTLVGDNSPTRSDWKLMRCARGRSGG